MMQLFLFFGSLHVTTNNFFKRLFSIQKSLNKWRHNDDPVIQKMTTNMQLKFNKYWESGGINYLLYVIVFLNPCCKFEYIELCFNKMYGVLDDLIKKLFMDYAIQHLISIESSTSSTLASNIGS